MAPRAQEREPVAVTAVEPPAPADPVAVPMVSGLSPTRVEALQRTAGNAAVVGLLQGSAAAVARQPAAAPPKESLARIVHETRDG